MSENVVITSFHAHIYFDVTTRNTAMHIRKEIGAKFNVRLGRCHDQAIGPHPKPMYQVAFLPHQFGEIVPWLMLNRQGLDVLVHPTTGDDIKDHTIHALWLGKKLELNIEFLKKLNTN